MDIFEYMRNQIGCEYISDLPFERAEAMEALGKLPPGVYTADQIEILKDYIFTERNPKLQAMDEYMIKG